MEPLRIFMVVQEAARATEVIRPFMAETGVRQVVMVETAALMVVEEVPQQETEAALF